MVREAMVAICAVGFEVSSSNCRLTVALVRSMVRQSTSTFTQMSWCKATLGKLVRFDLIMPCKAMHHFSSPSVFIRFFFFFSLPHYPCALLLASHQIHSLIEFLSPASFPRATRAISKCLCCQWAGTSQCRTQDAID
jgi:hypothetical protein